MSRGNYLMVFCYDVSDNRIRRAIAKILEGEISRVQYSVFEGRLTKAKVDAISQRIASLLQQGDSLRVYAVGSNGERRTRIYGDGPPIETNEGYWLL